MLKVDDLLREKRRYGLKEEVSQEEMRLLKKGLPIQKIIGFINFDDIDIYVNRKVLIPRYETYELIQYALRYINKDSRVLDLGCGSGYIGLTIKHKTNCEVVLSDIDDEAIIQTKENATRHSLDVKVIKSNLFENINGTFDVIVSNPPYIPEGTKLDKSVMEHEPHHALFAGEDGNDMYKTILLQAKKYVKKSGYLVMEISPNNVMFLHAMGCAILQDINGKDRIAIKRY